MGVINAKAYPPIVGAPPPPDTTMHFPNPLNGIKTMFSTKDPGPGGLLSPKTERLVNNAGAGALCAVAAGMLGQGMKKSLLIGAGVTAGLQLFGLRKKGA